MTVRAALLVLLAIAAIAAQGAAGSDAPERTALVRDALAGETWEVIEPGFEMKRVSVAGVTATAFRVDPDMFRFMLASQAGENGERVREFAERADAVASVNGGFFGEKAPGEDLFPVGLLRLGGNSFSSAWTQQGGFLTVAEGRLSIVPSVRGIPDTITDAVQSKPVLIEPGGKWAMNANLENLRRRTLVCLGTESDVVLVLITGLGMSLFEAGWLMRDPSHGGYFGCDSAIAMDGGGSTQFWLQGRPDLEVTGETPVHNALLVLRR